MEGGREGGREEGRRKGEVCPKVLPFPHQGGSRTDSIPGAFYSGGRRGLQLSSPPRLPQRPPCSGQGPDQCQLQC